MGDPCGGFDDQFKSDRFLAASGGFDGSDKGVHRIDIGRDPDLGDQYRIETITGLFDDIDDVAIHVMRIEAVDAYRNRFSSRAPVDFAKRFDHVFTRLFLVGRRDRVFEIEKDIIRRAVRGFFKQPGIGTRHRELAALQASPCRKVLGVAH